MAERTGKPVISSLSLLLKRCLVIVCGALALLPCGHAVAHASYISATLEAETLRPASGSRITLALHMTPARGWHGYWENPGDSGAPVSVAWNLPPGSVVGPMHYPVPQPFIVQGLMSHVYKQPYALLMRFAVPEGLAQGSRVTLSGRARWVACSATLCVPEQAPVAIDLVIGDGAVTTASRVRFDQWRAKLPDRLPRSARFEEREGRIRIAIPLPKGHRVTNPHFYPVDDRIIEHAARQAFIRRGDILIVDVKPAVGGSSVPGFDGVIATGPDRGFRLIARPGRAPR